jgi:hypothetical protein
VGELAYVGSRDIHKKNIHFIPAIGAASERNPFA